MSFVKDRIKSLEGELDRLQLVQTASINSGPAQDASLYSSSSRIDTARAGHLRTLIKSLSTSTRPPLNLGEASEIAEVLKNANFGKQQPTEQIAASGLDSELEWYLLGKAAIRTYGIILDDLIEKVSLMDSSSWYWTGVLSSNRSLGLYSIQTSPPRIWTQVRKMLCSIHQGENIVRWSWQYFYSLLKSIAHERFSATLQRSIINPLAWVHAEVLQKQSRIEQCKLSIANCLGCLLRFGFQRTSSWYKSGAQALQAGENRDEPRDWRIEILRSIAVLDATMDVLASTASFNKSYITTEESNNFHKQISGIEKKWDEFEFVETANLIIKYPKDASDQLLRILSNRIPKYSKVHYATLLSSGTPSRLTRYWLPYTVLAVSSTITLGVYLRSRTAIIEWIQSLGLTIFDFWTNWVIEPTMKVIGTIRHDEASAISILSRKSLEGDRASLERMILDFVIDNSQNSSLNDVQIADVRAKIQEGDLTPVLRVYEKEMQRPVYGSLCGSLIRALLIQVQKTKVDAEVAMGGIDSLLKSQELVFGFVGLTPGLLVCFGIVRWLGNLSTNRRSFTQRRKASQTLHLLRNIDRILSRPVATTGSLSFEQYGLLICEAVGIRKIAEETFPTEAFQDFLTDFDELVESSQSLVHQRRIADRLRWAYWRWL